MSNPVQTSDSGIKKSSPAAAWTRFFDKLRGSDFPPRRDKLLILPATQRPCLMTGSLLQESTDVRTKLEDMVIDVFNWLSKENEGFYIPILNK
jgi:hypothetical protein